MLRPSAARKHSTSNGKHNHGSTKDKDDNEDDDTTGKNKAFFSNKAISIVVSSFILLAIAANIYRARKKTTLHKQTIPVIRLGQAATTSNTATAITKDQDAALEYNKDGIRSHLVFSTDCSPYQHWQSYMVYYSAMKVRQPGHVTRIASGCNEQEAIEIQEWFDTHVSIMSFRFHLHLTPHFSSTKLGDYKFFNKPFGLRHWLEHGSELEGNTFEDDLVILIDPDMALLRPITGDFSNDRETVIGYRKLHKPPFKSMQVQHGKPFAQSYGLGAGWLKFDLSKIAGPDSPATKVIKEEAGVWYPAGPPYIATLRDMHQIAIKWTEFAPKVHAEYPHLLAEMYAYCIAAAHLELPHKLVDSMMVSNPYVGGEAWTLVDKIPMDTMCSVAAHPNHAVNPVPSVVHMCQRYALGPDWFFGKRRVPFDVFSCEGPLLKEPPSNVATLYDYKQPPGQREKKPISQKDAGREAFMVCSSTALLNEAATFYKKNYCPAGTANLEKTMRLGQMGRPISK